MKRLNMELISFDRIGSSSHYLTFSPDLIIRGSKPLLYIFFLLTYKLMPTVNGGGSEFPRVSQLPDYGETHLVTAASADTCNLDTVVKI